MSRPFANPFLQGHNVTERALEILDLARSAATERGHEGVSALHIALGLIQEGEGVGATALRFHGIALNALEQDLTQAVAALPHRPQMKLALTPDAEELLGRAATQAQALEHRYLGSEHLLLALLQDAAGVPARALARHGFRLEDAKARIQWILGSDIHNPEPYVGPQ